MPAELDNEHDLVQGAQRGDRRRGPAPACLAQMLKEPRVHARGVVRVTASERVASENEVVPGIGRVVAVHQLIHQRTQHRIRARRMHRFHSHPLAIGQAVLHTKFQRPRWGQLEQLPQSPAGRFEAQPRRTGADAEQNKANVVGQTQQGAHACRTHSVSSASSVRRRMFYSRG